MKINTSVKKEPSTRLSAECSWQKASTIPSLHYSSVYSMPLIQKTIRIIIGATQIDNLSVPAIMVTVPRQSSFPFPLSPHAHYISSLPQIKSTGDDKEHEYNSKVA